MATANDSSKTRQLLIYFSLMSLPFGERIRLGLTHRPHGVVESPGKMSHVSVFERTAAISTQAGRTQCRRRAVPRPA